VYIFITVSGSTSARWHAVLYGMCNSATRMRGVQYAREMRVAPGFGSSVDRVIFVFVFHYVRALCIMAARNSRFMVPPSLMGQGSIWMLLAMEIGSHFRCVSTEP